MLIALASVAVLAGGVAALAAVLGEEGPDEAARQTAQRGGRPALPPPPRGSPQRCPPPGPAVSLPDGRTLCGPRAERYIERRNRRQRRAQNRLLGFTAARRRQARRILARDRTLAALLGERSRRPAQLAPWHPEGRFEAIGAGAEYVLRSPIEVDAVLPYVCQGDRLKHGRARVRVREVTRLHALAHFASRRVVAIYPSAREGGPQPQALEFDRLPGSAVCPRVTH